MASSLPGPFARQGSSQTGLFARESTFDARGFGRSSNPPGGPESEAYADDLRALLDYLEVDDTFLVAQSMGGLTCLGFALAHPTRTRGLVLADTTAGIGDQDVVEILKRRQLPKEFLSVALDLSFPEREPARTFLYQEIYRMNPPRLVNYTDFTDGTGPKAAELSQMNVPTLLIVGEQDVSMPPPAMELCHKLIPGSRLEMVQGCGHSVHFERPEVFNKLVLDFFAGVQAGAKPL